MSRTTRELLPTYLDESQWRQFMGKKELEENAFNLLGQSTKISNPLFIWDIGRTFPSEFSIKPKCLGQADVGTPFIHLVSQLGRNGSVLDKIEESEQREEKSTKAADDQRKENNKKRRGTLAQLLFGREKSESQRETDHNSENTVEIQRVALTELCLKKKRILNSELFLRQKEVGREGKETMRTKMHVVVLGQKKVGKTSLLKSLVNQYDPTSFTSPSSASSDGQFYVPTVEDTFHVQFSDFRSAGDQMQQRSLLLLFHDTAGITDFGNIELRKPYLQVADAFLLVYSVLDPSAFSQMEALKKYLDREKNGASKERKEVPIVVVGTNCEMTGKKVDTESAFQWANREKVKLFEVSAHDRKSFGEMVQHLSERLFHSLKDSKFSLSRKLKPEKSNAQIVMDF